MSTEVPIDYGKARKEIEATKLGPLAVLSYPFGPIVNNEDLLSHARQCNGSVDFLKEAEKLIQRTGINRRRHSFTSETPEREVIATAAQIGGALIKSAMQAQGWNTIDYFVDTSACLPTQVRTLSLENAGINPETIIARSYRAACAGAVSAFIDSLANPKMQGKRVVICALETLSRHIATNQYDLANLNIPAIFGDDYAAIAYNTSDFELISAKTLVIPDGGTIRFETGYQLPVHDPTLVPEHYTFEKEGESIIAVSNEGVFIAIQKPDGNMPSTMDGFSTIKFFVPHTCAVIETVIREASQKGQNPKQVVMHQPSKKVLEGIQHRARKTAGLKDLPIPDFVLGEIGRSNSSSATTFVVLEHLAKEGQIDLGKPLLLCAPGIGAKIIAAVIKQR